MKTDPHSPADTRMMGIVHDALRRDLHRTRSALSTEPYPSSRRRTMLADHVLWMMRFLHDHHTAEDAGLWPVVRLRNPQAAALLDVMDTDHATIAPALSTVQAAARDYRLDDAARMSLLTALAELDAVLLPHLDREEHDTMPMVAASITTTEWRNWDQQHNVKTKSFMELGTIGHWLLDGLTPERRHVVVHEVPAVPRFILVHGFARRYTRQARLRWSSAQ